MKRKSIFIITIMVLLCSLFVNSKVYAAKEPTDKINNYEVILTPREDASVDISYHIEWEVLESDKAGALTWVRIGIPNKHVDELKAVSDNIKSIKTHKDGSEIYADITFQNSYYKGDVVSFDFSLHQDYLYSVNSPHQGEVTYTFRPGWFDEINVERLYIRWNGKEAVSVYPLKPRLTSYYEWNTALDMGEKYTIKLTYGMDAYNFKMTAEEKEEEEGTGAAVAAIGIVAVAILIISLIILSKDDYDSGSGFGSSSKPIKRTYGVGHIHRTTTCVSSGCACACACACTCAGGGRAGCSVKDFYHTKLKLEQLKRKSRGTLDKE